MQTDPVQTRPVEKQVVIIYAAVKKYLMSIPVNRIAEFEAGLFDYIETHEPDVLRNIKDEKEISEATEKRLVKAIEAFKEKFV